MEANFQKIKCPICGFDDAEFYATKKGYNFCRSKNCGLIFIWPIPKDINIYNADYFYGATNGYGYTDYDKDKAPMLKTFGKYLEIIGKYSKKRGHLLDIGTATGYFLKIANDRGWQCFGVEISDYAAKKAREKDLNVLTGTLENAYLPKNYFDAITMWDILEHLNNPQRNIEILSGLLKSDGVLAINTPDSSSFWARLLGKKWHLILPPEHIFLFSRKSLKILLEKNGFEILKLEKIGKSFTLSYIFNTLYKWQGIALWNKLADLFKGDFWSKMVVPINFRDNIFVIARKI